MTTNPSPRPSRPTLSCLLSLAAGLVLALPQAASALPAAVPVLPTSPSGPTSPSRLLRAERPIHGRYIVVLRDPALERADREPMDGEARDLARAHGARIRSTWSRALRGFSAEMSERDAGALATNPRVAWVEEDGEVRSTGTQSGPGWDLDRIDQRSAPLDGSYTWQSEGAGVHVYVVDSGIRTTHQEFQGRAHADFDALRDGSGAGDCDGHGTHVAATVGGITFGVAKGVELHAVRVLDCAGTGATSDAISGLDWVAEHHVKPAVANVSLGGAASDALDLAVENAIDAGVTVVVSAGNGARDACASSPGRVPRAVTVGASDLHDQQASFSNYGRCVDLFAPGVEVRSAFGESDSATRILSGTSMAAPHVAGAAAMYLSVHPLATPDVVEQALREGSTKGALGALGAGSPNAMLDVSLIGPGVPTQGEVQATSGSAQRALSTGAGGGGCSSGSGASVLALLVALLAMRPPIAAAHRAGGRARR